ncbi:hypothetical protein SESBI_16189 [Sesbania bispinosa]|nr:hypothetical protein SESBI_16189 [Sesbania bispinosa]
MDAVLSRFDYDLVWGGQVLLARSRSFTGETDRLAITWGVVHSRETTHENLERKIMEQTLQCGEWGTLD